jgi:hypothetical protein
MVQQLQLQKDAVGEGALASAHEDRHEEEVALVHQPRPERAGGKVGAPDGEVSCRLRLELADRVGVEVALDPRPGGGGRLQGPRVDDLLGRPPDVREVRMTRDCSAELGSVPQPAIVSYIRRP